MGGLRYVHRGPLNANVILVTVGAAAPYFYGGDGGKLAPRSLAPSVLPERTYFSK